MALTLSIFFCRRDILSLEDIQYLASFLGEQLHNLHLLPVPQLKDSTFSLGNIQFEKDSSQKIGIPVEWELFISTLNRKKNDVCSRLTKWYVNSF